MVPPPASRHKETALQPPTKRRKKPASNSEGAAPWETTRVFHQPKPALPTIQLNGVVARGTKGPSLKAPSHGSRHPSASASVTKQAFAKRQVVPSKQASKDVGNDTENKSMLARSKSLSRLRAKPVSSGTVEPSSSASASLRRKRSSANLMTASSGNRRSTDDSETQQTKRKNDRVQGDQQPLKCRALASKDGTASSSTQIGNANSGKAKIIKPAMEGKIKAQIASLATRIVTDPHENVGNLSQLRQIAIQNKGRLAALAILTEAQVYRDIAPGYRIRTVTEKEAAVKVSKEVAQVRSFEQSLLSGFRRFIKSCTSLSQWRATGNNQTPAAKDMTEVRHAACKALSTVLAALPHFNEADAIATAVVDFASDRDEAVRTLAGDALTEVLSNAHKASGPVAQTCITAAKALAAAAEGRKARMVSEETLAPLSEINFAAFARLPIGKQQKGQQQGVNGKGSGGKKLSKRKREMLAVKNRKRPKDEEEMAASEKADADLDRDIAEAEADATPQETIALRKALLDAVCTACFNVIKTASGDVIDEDAKKNIHKDSHANIKRTRKPPPALSSALRGLLRVARYVGPDVIDAIIAALIPMLERGPYPLALRLRCATVAYEIVASRNVATAAAAKAAAASNRSDPTIFETDAAALDSSLYGMLITLCGAHEVRLLDEDTVILDLLETLYAATSSRRLPVARAAALARRVAIVAIASAGTHGSTAGLLKSAQALFDSSMAMPVSLILNPPAGYSSWDNNGDDMLDEDDEKEGMHAAARKRGLTPKQQQQLQKRRDDAIAELGLIDEFDLSARSADAASAARSIAWELAALVDHFHPTVRLIAQQCIDGMCGDRLPKKSHGDNPVVVARRHASDDGGFNPLPQERLLQQQFSGGSKKHQARADDILAVDIEHDAVVARLYGTDDAGRKEFVHFAEGGLVGKDNSGLEGQQQDNGEDAYIDWCDGYFGRAFEDYHLNN